MHTPRDNLPRGLYRLDAEEAISFLYFFVPPFGGNISIRSFWNIFRTNYILDINLINIIIIIIIIIVSWQSKFVSLQIDNQNLLLTNFFLLLFSRLPPL